MNVKEYRGITDQIVLIVHFSWLLIVFGYLFLFFNNVDQDINQWLIIATIGTIWYIFSWYKLFGNIFTPYTMFIIFSFLFHFGQVLLWSTQLVDDPYTLSMMYAFPMDKILNASVFSTCCLALCHTGAIFNSIFKPKQRVRINDFGENRTSINVCKITGYFLLSIAIIPTIVYDGSYFKAAIQSGYLAIYDLEINHGGWGDLAKLLKPAIVFLILGFRDKKIVVNFIFLISISYSLLKMYIIGQRGYEVIFVISLIWLRHKAVSPIRGIKAFKYSIYSFFLLTLLSTISQTRGLARGQVDISIALQSALKDNPLVKTLAEFGTTLTTPIVTMMYQPNVLPYAYGSSYIDSLFVILPNVGGFFNPILDGAIPSIVLGKFAPALGGSFIAEFYYNFGWYGMLLSILVGFLFARLSIMANNAKSVLQIASYTTLLGIQLWLVRDSFSSVPRAVFLYIIFPYILWKLLYSYSTRKGSTIKRYSPKGVSRWHQ